MDLSRALWSLIAFRGFSIFGKLVVLGKPVVWVVWAKWPVLNSNVSLDGAFIIVRRVLFREDAKRDPGSWTRAWLQMKFSWSCSPAPNAVRQNPGVTETLPWRRASSPDLTGCKTGLFLKKSARFSETLSPRAPKMVRLMYYCHFAGHAELLQRRLSKSS